MTTDIAHRTSDFGGGRETAPEKLKNHQSPAITRAVGRAPWKLAFRSIKVQTGVRRETRERPERERVCVSCRPSVIRGFTVVYVFLSNRISKCESRDATEERRRAAPRPRARGDARTAVRRER